MIETSELNYQKPKPASPPLRSKARRTARWLLLVLALISVYGLATLGFDQRALPGALAGFLKNLYLMFLHPHLGQNSLAGLVNALLMTVALALYTTLIGAVIAFFLALLTARNLAPRWLSQIMRSLAALIRAVPTILWVLVYTVVIGLGTDAAIIGLSFHSVAYLVKVYAESIEAIPQEKLDALRASGTSFWLVVRHAIWPSVKLSLLSWTFIRFEINFTNAVAVGAAAGTGGIGYYLFMSSAFYFDFSEVGLMVYLILLFALLLEGAAVLMRRGLRTPN